MTTDLRTRLERLMTEWKRRAEAERQSGERVIPLVYEYCVSDLAAALAEAE